MQRINPAGLEIEITTAIEQICAWPNLTLLPDGSVLAAVFNQSCHGMWEGDLDAYISTDAGRTWTRRGCIAPHGEPHSNRMNCAVGLAHDGSLIALCGGWRNRAPRGQSKPFAPQDRRIPRIYRSTDAGCTWTDLGEIELPPSGEAPVPFGDIHPTAPSRLVTTGYAPLPPDASQRTRYQAFLYESRDDGRTWRCGSSINPNGNETALLPLNPQHFLAASREETDTHLDLFTSADAGQTWRSAGPLSLPRQVTGHLLRLRDGRVLLTYGNRCTNNFGIDIRYSPDAGRTWQAPLRIADTPMADCGYPSTVELPDGWLLTAYYSQLPGEYQYAMFAARWRWTG